MSTLSYRLKSQAKLLYCSGSAHTDVVCVMCSVL